MSEFKEYKIRVNETESKVAQELLFKLGYKWPFTGQHVVWLSKPWLSTGITGQIYWHEENQREDFYRCKLITLEQLGELAGHRIDQTSVNPIADNKGRNLKLEAWLIETTGEEMMANHLGPNWNRFNDEFGFYPNISMTIADLVWQHQQAKVEGLERRNQLLSDSVKEMGDKHIRDTDLINQQAGMLAELQKRVDTALELMQKPVIVGEPSNYVCARFKELEQALKGEG